MRIHFKATLIRQLWKHTRSSRRRVPTYSQLFEGACRKDGKDVSKDLPFEQWPKSRDVDKTKLPPSLHLVGDSGIYIMSSGMPPLLKEPGSTSNLVAYARECDPEHMPFDFWWRAKNEIFGGDDGVELLTWQFVENMLANEVDGWVMLNVTPQRIATVPPRRRK